MWACGASESFCRWRYAQHLHLHGAHRMNWIDAVEIAFDEEQTKTEEWLGEDEDGKEAKRNRKASEASLRI